MSIGTSDIYLISVFLILRFGLVWLIKSKPQTKPNHVVSNKFIRIHPNQMRFFVISVWFAIFLLNWFGFEHP